MELLIFILAVIVMASGTVPTVQARLWRILARFKYRFQEPEEVWNRMLRKQLREKRKNDK